MRGISHPGDAEVLVKRFWKASLDTDLHQAFVDHTFVCQGQRAVEVLLLHSPCCVIDLVGHSTGSNAAHLDGCGETGHTSALGESKSSGSDLLRVLHCAGAVLVKTHTGWENGAEESGHAFIPKVGFPALPAQLSTPCYPSAISRYYHL